VENAIRHGLSTRLDAGSIDIDARQIGKTVVVSVIDDGSADRENVSGLERVGLGNTRARLEALYGRQADLALDRTPEGRTR
jgi:LytS/YehU family sensor histidine kinase